MKKETYYQRKKREHEELVQSLRDDIRELVIEQNPIKVFEIKARYKMKYRMEETVWMGETNRPHSMGIIHSILKP